MSRLTAMHAAALCMIAGSALGDSAGFARGGLSNAERKRLRDRQNVGPAIEVAGANLPGETNRQFAARMKVSPAPINQQPEEGER